MTLWPKIALVAAGALVAVVGALYGIGLMLPREHTATRRVVISSASVETVWARIADLSAAPAWRPDVKSVMRLDDRAGHQVWREDSISGDSITLETVEYAPPTLLVRKIVNEDMFGGTWRIEVANEGAGARVTITEEGWIDSAIFRVLGRLVFGHGGTIERYLRNLAVNFGEPQASIEPAIA